MERAMIRQGDLCILHVFPRGVYRWLLRQENITGIREGYLYLFFELLDQWVTLQKQLYVHDQLKAILRWHRQLYPLQIASEVVYEGFVQYMMEDYLNERNEVLACLNDFQRYGGWRTALHWLYPHDYYLTIYLGGRDDPFSFDFRDQPADG